MIELAIPVEQIPFIRTIEGRKFRNGKWLFPNSAQNKLVSLGLLESDYKVSNNVDKSFVLSDHLYSYQKDICNKALNAGCYGIFAETGCGKTVMFLEISKHYGKTLVLCPLSVIETTWIADCNKFYPDIKIINCWGHSKKQRLAKLQEQGKIFVMNYESFKILHNEIRNMGFDCIVVDESSIMKNMTSQITTMLLEITDIIPHRFVMSGTPTPNRFDEIFSQMKFVNAEILGNNKYGFLQTYSHQDMSDPHVWYQTQEDKDKYYAKLSQQATFIRKEDCIDLPPKVFEVKEFTLAKEHRKYYDDMVQDIQSHINEWSKFEFTAKLMKLREIVSGFVIGRDGSITDFETDKDKLLQNTLNEIGDKPVIIWCQFRHEIERLAKEFGGTALTSQTPKRDDIIRDFQQGKIKYLFTHPKLLGKGLTFTNCTYNVYYSLSFSYEEFRQSQDRIHRIGQDNKCTYIILQGKDTIDKKIYNCLTRKGNVVDELYLEMGLRNSFTQN